MKGFTLVEIVVVLAIVLLLSGIAIPMVSGYVEDGRRGRAEAEAKLIASGMASFYRDVGTWPARDAEGQNELRVLLTGFRMPTGDPFAGPHLFGRWAMRRGYADLLDNHLVDNTPMGSSSAAYPEQGPARWRGPYLAGGSPLDPWGRPYVVNVVSAFSTSDTAYFRMYVVSAGPNGYLETSPYGRAGEDIAGDDVGLVLHERRAK